ncbi:MAG TPA: response regulator [Syntrophaceae bacterium]|nr:response regulator [Syntrophaceae bacterium]
MQKLLLIDDEEGIRKVWGIALRDAGYEVITAKNGEEGLKFFSLEHPPIVLTDIRMPGMDGIQVLKSIKEMSPDTEVIVITGYGEMDLAIRSLQLDASDFINKPIGNEALFVALKRAEEKLEIKRKLKEYTENLERKVEEATRELIEAERLATIGQTVAGLAHAIKNILGGLKGGVYVVNTALKKQDRNLLKTGWNMVERNIDNISNLVLDMLNYSKERKPEYEVCSPNTVAEEVCGLMEPKARESGIEIFRNFDPTIGEVSLDPKGIHCCLLNLVSNAIDACVSCPDRPGRVEVRTTTENKWAVRFDVSDNGCGMDEETQKKVFSRFFSTKGSKGTGLGLLVTQKIVQEHDGIINFVSEVGKGSTFTIRLPHRRSS